MLPKEHARPGPAATAGRGLRCHVTPAPAVSAGRDEGCGAQALLAAPPGDVCSGSPLAGRA